MARTLGTGKGLNKPITIRLPPDEEAFYRRRASDHGVSLSAFLTKTLVAGVIAENLLDVEDRIGRLIDTIPTERPAGGGDLPEDLALSLFTCEALLTAIVQAQDHRTLYAAHDAAKAKIRKRKGG